MKQIKCHICNSDRTWFLKKEGNWNIVQCELCGLVYVNPQPEEDFLKEHYQSYLPESQSDIDNWGKMMAGVFGESLRIINKTTGARRGKLLDIGCAHGFFIEAALNTGWEASGIDLSKQAVQYAEGRGLEVSNSTLFEKKYKDNYFDVITMFYVLEHLPDPGKYLKEIHRVLKPSGVLLVRVPHTTPIVKMLKMFNISNTLYDVPSHLTDFSPQSLKHILKKTGFNAIRTSIGGMTYPRSLSERCISCFFGTVGTILHKITFGKYLLPGISKTTIAIKNAKKIS
ncbi:MAG: class I SAM-dependent methyltransferase [Candidatus Omnitrophica bacterium]|nr:class I SAM-dependent methyltransferase [Candidatus Omnitrophota bacterium]